MKSGWKWEQEGKTRKKASKALGTVAEEEEEQEEQTRFGCHLALHLSYQGQC